MSSLLLEEWNKAKPWIKAGYYVLGKEFTVAIPGVSFPAIAANKNSGIGSPYGTGAEKVAFFFNGLIDKVLLTPTGNVFPPYFSPYTGSFGYNHFFIPLDKVPFLSNKTLEKVYASTSSKTKINYTDVVKNYALALHEVYDNYLSALRQGDANALVVKQGLQAFIRDSNAVKIDAEYYAPKEQDYYIFIEYLASTFVKNAPFDYIGDVPVKLPDSYIKAYKDIFLRDFTLGTPADYLNPRETDWGFPVIDPDKIFNKDGSLGLAGKLLMAIFTDCFKRNKGGLRIDHFIGLVDPFVISHNKKYESGRLYSSPDHPFLKKYAKKTPEEFATIAKNILLAAAVQSGVDFGKIYIEDIGSRPERLDAVIEMLALGKMRVSQFVEPMVPDHIYRLRNAKRQDIAVLDTHDTPSINELFFNMSAERREQHALQLLEDLRFNYAPDLSEAKNLIRMKWGELMACPARRVMCFFTSFTGQKGRFNVPGNKVSWQLRMDTDFEKAYFHNLKQGLAYNPFDAICLGIYARGDEFFNANRELVDRLRTIEQNILAMID